MSAITLNGNTVYTSGNVPRPSNKAPEFTLTANDFTHHTLEMYSGSKLILNIFPSLDTDTCAASVRKFNEAAAALPNVKVLCISRDLPFAQARFCGAEGIENVICLSDYATGDFGKNYGLVMVNGPLAQLHSRAVVIIDEKGVVSYSQQVKELTNEPDYQAVLDAVK